jgi:cell division protein FtsZ
METIMTSEITEKGARCKVIGIGGSGCNAVGHMIHRGVPYVVEFIAIDKDTEELRRSKAGIKIMLGMGESGFAAQARRSRFAGADMVFIVTGMGGTAIGAAPIIAEIVRNLDALTVAVVTLPFAQEGEERIRLAEAGIIELQKHVDTLFVVRSDKVKEMAMPGEHVSLEDMFQAVDHLLCDVVRDIAWSACKEKLVSIDFNDIRHSILGGMNRGAVGFGSAVGANRARLASEDALASPLLEDTDFPGVRGLLVLIKASSNLNMSEVEEVLLILRNEVSESAVSLYGVITDENMQDELRVTVIFTTALNMARRLEAGSQ